MKNSAYKTGLTLMRRSGRLALHTKLIVLWIAALLVPTALLGIPFWRALSAQLDHSVHASQWARQLDGLVVADLVAKLMEGSAPIAQAGSVGLLLTLLLSPWLTGMVATLVRQDPALGSNASPGFAKLARGGFHEYGRMLRVMLWSVVPLGIALGLGAAGMHFAGKYEQIAILQSDAELMSRAVMAVTGLLVLLTLASMDAARAQLIVYHRRSSVVKAWWHGCLLLRRRLLLSVGLYLTVSMIGLGLAAGITALRISLPQLGTFWLLLGVVLAQCGVAAIAWMRITRLLAFVQLAQP